MNHRARTVAIAPLLLALGLPACGSSYAERREALDAEWAVTNARSDEIHAEYNRRMRQAKSPEEREAIIAWRNAELEKNFAEHRARKEDALQQIDD